MDKLDAAIESLCSTIFLLTGSIFNLQNTIDKIHKAGKKVYVDVDLMEGFSKDSTFLEYVQDILLPDGIITTKSSLVRKAKSMGIFVIQRFFIFDSMSLQTGINSAREVKPDIIEVLPGVMPRIIKEVRESTHQPIISSGLIISEDDIVNALDAGAMAIATSSAELWNRIKFNQLDSV